MFIATVKSNSVNIHMLLTGFSVVKMESTSLYKLLACFLAVKTNSLNLYKLRNRLCISQNGVQACCRLVEVYGLRPGYRKPVKRHVEVRRVCFGCSIACLKEACRGLWTTFCMTQSLLEACREFHFQYRKRLLAVL